MIDFVRMQTDLTDFEVGSVIRTIIEAAALEDDEQYFQMVQLLDAFRLSTAAGQDLDDRVEEFGITRLQPAAAAGEVLIGDLNAITSTIAFDIPVSTTLIEIEDSSKFPTAGYPYTVRFGEGTVDVEDLSVTNNNTATNELTVAGGTTKAHSLGERATYVSGAADKNIADGLRVQVPSSGDDAAIIYVTVESGVLVNGDYESTPIRALAEVPGSNGNITAGKISEFVSSPPFDGAAVRNAANFAGGRDLETDAQLRDRARDLIQSLSRGTVLTLKEGVVGVSDPVTGQRVTTSNILEDFVNDEVVLYVDDGTGFTPDQVSLARSQVATAIAAPIGTVDVADSTDFPEEGWLILSPNDPAQAEIVEYSAVDYTIHRFTLVGTTANTHDIGDVVSLLDVVEDSAESGQNFFQVNRFPIVRNSYQIWVDAGSGPVLQVENSDYYLNRGTGQLEFIGAGLAAGSVVVANYDYYTGLLAEVQKVVDGDTTDPTNYPGLRAAGIHVVVETPTIRRITVRVSISARAGIQEADLTANVQESIESYINGLGVGENVIVAEIIERAMAVDGMFDIVVSTPTSNITVLENELPVPYDVNGNSLVTVT